ncbi:1-aminocyclopropane-1-carboxylate synthase 1-like [Euphorbia lathyris]|uniref:1-aminocyclopropane-1-carboxylate synthase 1-like n=1 Tax=Euphorbia lathyris TaxID=212925 RepID=UPI0033132E85
MVSGQLLSKIATSEGHGENSPYFDGWKAYQSNPFHPTRNPDGVIQMGLAENQLCFDLISDWIKQNPEASICTYEGVDKLKDIAIFQDYHGLPEFRQAIAKFMEMVRGNKVKYDPDRVVMGGGATGANEIIMFCLADPGDAFLLPSPYYPAFDRDLTWRTGVKIIPVDCYSSNNFQITKQALEAAYDKAQKSGIKVKGLILANPSNPLGTTLSKNTLKDIVRFINEKNIHIVVDEIYAATIFNSPNFISISEIIGETDCNKDLVHIVYSLSKDMGLPGFRVGIVYSYNDSVVSCARKMSSFGLVSSQTQYMLAAMLSDEKFVGNFLAESARRLKKRHGRFTEELEKVKISCLKSNAGLFVWMDLRHLMQDSTFEGEMSLWRVIINEVKLNVSPGFSFHCKEPGWFRVCFANMDDETVEVALKRIIEFVGKRPVQIKNKNKWQKNLRLSFKDRRFEDNVLSPHSPMTPSPLVRAK